MRDEADRLARMIRKVPAADQAAHKVPPPVEAAESGADTPARLPAYRAPARAIVLAAEAAARVWPEPRDAAIRDLA
jgi:hypothetical protein